MKKGFVANIEAMTLKNGSYRKVLYTGKYSQLVLMSLKPGDEIGEEVHDDIDQFFRFEQGNGAVIIDGVKHRVRDGSGVSWLLIKSGKKKGYVPAADIVLCSETDDGSGLIKTKNTRARRLNWTGVVSASAASGVAMLPATS